VKTKEATVDVFRRIYDSYGDGCSLELRPWPDSPETALELHTHDEESKKYYGDLRLTMNLDFAEALANALLAAVAELRSAPMRNTAK
jgi:hypothetical protein